MGIYLIKPVKTINVNLLYAKNVVRNLLTIQELVDVRHKLQKLKEKF